jgi:flagellar hook-associated protein 1 FlgK
MPSLSASYAAAANALSVVEEALEVTQNNVDNSTTPGYARQTLELEAQPLDIAGGEAGGVAAGGLQDSRNVWLEDQVQSQTSLLGQYTAQAQTTSSIQAAFDVTGTGGVSAALSGLFQDFSAWSETPSDSTARQNVLNGAQNVAQSINTLSNSLSQSGSQIDSNIDNTVTQINALAGQIQQYNVECLDNAGTGTDPGAQAQLYSALDSLSSLTNFSAVRQSDGTITILLSGGSPLVAETNQYNIQAVPTAAGDAILDSNGNDITSQVASGQLGGLLDVRNNTLASIVGTSTSQGTLNQFAQALADTVNGILENGKTSSDPSTAAAGSALFTYTPGVPNEVASSLAVSGIDESQLAPVDQNGNANGNCNQLAALANSTATLPSLGGMTLTGFYGQIAANAGSVNQNATANQTSQQETLAQVQNLRDQASGVDLDQEAAQVLQFQRAYQSVAEVLTVLNTLADSLLTMMPEY